MTRMTTSIFDYARRAAREGDRGNRGGLPCPILKIEKKCPDFVKNADCVQFLVKFFIQNVVLRVSRRISSQIFPCKTSPALKYLWLCACMPAQKNFDQLLIFVNLYQHAQNQFIPSVHSSDTILESHHVTGHTHFCSCQPLKTFKLIFMKLYQHVKNKLIPLVNSVLESSDQIGHINMLKMRLFHQFPQEK